jgi:hypothetical protein
MAEAAAEGDPYSLRLNRTRLSGRSCAYTNFSLNGPELTACLLLRTARKFFNRNCDCLIQSPLFH